MDKEYLKNYGGPGISYEESWRDFTVWPVDLVKALQQQGLHINSIIDFGAADGRWLNEFRELYAKPMLKVSGVELVLEYFPHAAEFVRQGRIQDWQPESFDMAFITALAYLDEQELHCFMKKISAKCKYFVPHMECWDTWRFRKDGLSLPEEKTLLCLADWEILFANYGLKKIYSDYFYIFENTGNIAIPPQKFLFEYKDAHNLVYDNLAISYDQQGALLVKGQASIEQLQVINEQFVAKRYCFEEKPPSGKWTYENNLWCSKFYDIY